METAGKTIDEKELSDAMKETGLGTPATRASIIEVLLKREYIVRNGKNLEATDKGVQLIEVVHPEVKSPVMTGQWEAYLKRIQRGEAQLEPFLDGIEEYVRKVVGKVGQLPAAPRRANGTVESRPAPLAEVVAPQPQRVSESLMAATGEPLEQAAAAGLWLRAFPGKSGGSLPDSDCRAGRAAGDANGRWEVAMLPVAGVWPGAAQRW